MERNMLPQGEKRRYELARLEAEKGARDYARRLLHACSAIVG
jgi:hypothetical protein